jgi:hypothetical protein
MRSLMLASVVGLATLVGCPPTQAEPYTTRVEPRPAYGATVTIEAGVRVFRPLPPHDRVIINPGNATPVYLGIDAAPYYRSFEGYRR